MDVYLGILGSGCQLHNESSHLLLCGMTQLRPLGMSRAIGELIPPSVILQILVLREVPPRLWALLKCHTLAEVTAQVVKKAG